MIPSQECGLSPETQKKITHVLEKFQHVEKAILYGSRAKGNFKTGSDIDLTLVAPALSPDDFLKIEQDLDSMLLPYKIDLSLLNQIQNASLLDHIQRVGRVFYVLLQS
jgi:predicted nucleotidyltransferase